ncbi:MAG: LCCL domain-containing protein [Alphaproteobacteria bacterium]|nr:LCCL domain-containing protein [Alphaproteobacteria bacterium]
MMIRTMRILFAVLALAVFGWAPASAQDIQSCPRNAKNLAGTPPGQALRCVCTIRQIRGSVWGSGRYTTDSSVCRAALHAGVISRSGGNVRIYAGRGCRRFDGSVRNGIRTGRWGAYGRTFAFRYPLPLCAENIATGGEGEGGDDGGGGASLAACPRNMKNRFMPAGRALRCSCAAYQMVGSVWGTRRYTADSSVCKAARHAGVIGPNGGSVSVFKGGGCRRYLGTVRYGIRTGRWGAYRSSFAFRYPMPRCFGGGGTPAKACDPSFGGKYVNLLRRIRVPQDRRRYGLCRNYGRYSGSSWAGYRNLPAGYWTYKYPHWYIWGRRTR